MDKKKDIKIIRIRAGLVFLVTLLLVFGCTFLVNQNQQRREKLKAAYTAESTISRIEVQLNRYLAESDLVKKSIEEGLTISDKQFATLSRLMQDEDDIIKVHEIAKDGIVSQIYPMEGNEDVIGLNMIENPERKKEARLARDSGEYTVRLNWCREETVCCFLTRYTERMLKDVRSSGVFLFLLWTGENLSKKWSWINWKMPDITIRYGKKERTMKKS